MAEKKAGSAPRQVEGRKQKLWVRRIKKWLTGGGKSRWPAGSNGGGGNNGGRS
jgi:hypothetical protein